MAVSKPIDRRYIFKTIVIGEGGSGKTNLVTRYCSDQFKADSKLTVGVSMHLKDVPGTDEAGPYRMTLQLWDMGGQDQFRFIIPSYCLGAKACIAVFDIKRYSSLTNLSDWFEMLYTKTVKPIIPTVLIASKCDLRSPGDITQVPLEDAREFAAGLTKKYPLYEKFPIDVVETSAKTGVGVKDAFDAIGKRVLEYAKSPYYK